MGLNIKNERVCSEVRRLAELTGTSQTSAVEDAVRRRLAELEGEEDRVAAKVRAIMDEVREFAGSLTPEEKAAVWRESEEMYDEYGLPR